MRLSTRLTVAMVGLVLFTAVTVELLIHHNLEDRKSTRLNSSHQIISYAVFCLKKKRRGDWTNYYLIRRASEQAAFGAKRRGHDHDAPGSCCNEAAGRSAQTDQEGKGDSARRHD